MTNINDDFIHNVYSKYLGFCKLTAKDKSYLEIVHTNPEDLPQDPKSASSIKNANNLFIAYVLNNPEIFPENKIDDIFSNIQGFTKVIDNEGNVGWGLSCGNSSNTIIVPVVGDDDKITSLDFVEYGNRKKVIALQKEINSIKEELSEVEEKIKETEEEIKVIDKDIRETDKSTPAPTPEAPQVEQPTEGLTVGLVNQIVKNTPPFAPEIEKWTDTLGLSEINGIRDLFIQFNIPLLSYNKPSQAFLGIKKLIEMKDPARTLKYLKNFLPIKNVEDVYMCLAIYYRMVYLHSIGDFDKKHSKYFNNTPPQMGPPQKKFKLYYQLENPTKDSIPVEYKGEDTTAPLCYYSGYSRGE